MRQLFEKVATSEAGDDGRADFDFLFGRWRVTHRRLRQRLVDNTQWDTFDGLIECRPIIGGLGNIDDNWIALPDGAYQAASLRLFDPMARQWSIWWADSRTGQLDKPVKGGFRAGIGTFTCEDLHNGQNVVVRFIWSEITERAAKWEQAFSPDGGTTWETNWEMMFSR